MPSENSIVFRTARNEDWDDLWPLLIGMGQTDSEEGTRNRFANIVRRNDHYVPMAFAANRGIGYAWVQDYGPHLRAGHRTARLHDLYVHPAWRHQSVGRRLFKSITTLARRRGVRWLQWQASQESVAFYEHLGYRGDTVSDLAEHPLFEIDFGEGND